MDTTFGQPISASDLAGLKPVSECRCGVGQHGRAGGVDSVVVIDGISSLMPLGSEVLSDGETFYIATAEIDSFAAGGGAFRLGFPAGGFTVLADSMSSVLIDSIGSQVVAVDSNRVQINDPPVFVVETTPAEARGCGVDLTSTAGRRGGALFDWRDGR